MTAPINGFSPYRLSPLDHVHQLGSMMAPPQQMLANGHPINSDPMHLLSLYTQRDLNLIGGNSGMGNPGFYPGQGLSMSPYFPQQQQCPPQCQQNSGGGMEIMMTILLQLMMMLMQLLSSKGQQQPPGGGPSGGGKPSQINGETGPHKTDEPGGYGRNAWENLKKAPEDKLISEVRYTPTDNKKLADVFGFAEERLNDADKNDDGKLDKEEAEANGLDIRWDANNDKFLTADELAARTLAADTDGNGSLTLKEVETAKRQQKNNPEAYAEVVKEVHKELDLAKKYEEFKKVPPPPPAPAPGPSPAPTPTPTPAPAPTPTPTPAPTPAT